jgi:chemotaxis protein methyltransferase CheR
MSIITIEVNSLNTQKKVSQLIEKLDYKNNYEITFRHIKFLPYELIIKLESIKDNLKIIVDDRKLKYYLLNLNLNVIFIEHEQLFTSNILDNKKYVAIGGSAGSLAKIIDLIKFLPKSDLTFFIIMHHKSDEKSILSDILKKYTIYYDIVEVHKDTKIKPATIYIAPPSKHLIIKENLLITDDSDSVNFSKPSISVSFSSFSNVFKDKFLAIILCGYGNDGSNSLKTIKENGGSVIVEQLFECQAIAMLEAAIHTKQFDKILSINDISTLFYDKYYKTYSIKQNLDSFLLAIKETYNYDYTQYNKAHIIRRIEHYYNILESKNFSSFKYKILNNNNLFQDLFLDISINITTFFRNSDVYIRLKDEIRERFKDIKRIKIWCAGCSSGEEPYSIAILLKELGYLDKSIIYATDINKIILENAKNGLYSKDSFEEFNNNYNKIFPNKDFKKYFDFYDNFVSVKDELKKSILFFKHNLVQNKKIDDFQLIICRNVIIYFNKDLTIKVFNLFDESLEANGLLLLGESETFHNNYNYEVISKTNKIFLK